MSHKLSLEDIHDIVLHCYGLEVNQNNPPVQYDSYEDTVYSIAIKTEKNESISDYNNGNRFVLKIYGEERKMQRELTNVKLSVVKRCYEKCAPYFQLPIPMEPKESPATPTILYKVPNASGLSQETKNEKASLEENEDEILVRLTNFIPGQIIDAKKVSKELVFQCGKCAAILDEALEEVSIEPISMGTNWEWNVLYLGEEFSRKYVSSLDDNVNKKAVKEVLDEFVTHVKPKLSGLPWQWIHNDLSDQNIVANSDNVVGFIDMDEMVYSHRVVELSVMFAYFTMMSTKERCIMLMRQLYLGYSSTSPLSTEELDILYNLTLCRYVQSLCIGNYMNKYVDPDNDYITNTAKNGWEMFHYIIEIGRETFFYKILK